LNDFITTELDTCVVLGMLRFLVAYMYSRLTRASNLSAGMFTEGCAWLKRGTMVCPEWPPMTGMVSLEGFDSPVMLATKVSARTTSRVVTPKSFLASNTPAAFRTSAAMGTVEFTGLEMTKTNALGQNCATPSMRPLTMPALILKRSSRVIPGLPMTSQHLHSVYLCGSSYGECQPG
jgi:hypothetical protein